MGFAGTEEGGGMERARGRRVRRAVRRERECMLECFGGVAICRVDGDEEVRGGLLE